MILCKKKTSRILCSGDGNCDERISESIPGAIPYKTLIYGTTFNVLRFQIN